MRIPRELNFPEQVQDVEIERRGDELVIRPLKRQFLSGLRQHLQAFHVDFLRGGRPAAEPEADRQGW